MAAAAATVNGTTGVSSSGPAATSGGILQAAAGMYEQLKDEWNRKSPNLSKCGEELGRLKLVLLELNFLPTTGTKLTKQQLILARDILEIGAQWSILCKDIPSFERYMAQLKCYYFDYKEQLPESAYMHQLLGLNLLFLLSQNRVAEFHTELERLPAKDIQTNVYIKHPVSLEQYLMEGSYNKVFLAKGNIPAESYTFFIDILLDTIRYMVRVRAVVMARDDSSGGWLPVGGGGLSQVSVCRVRGARPEGGARQGHYVIHGERLRDQKTTLECTLRPGLVYNKVNPIFHHWSLGDCKFGLTFQSPAEADEFQKSLQAALAALSRGSLTPSSSSSSSSPSRDTAETPCPLTSHVDSDSSSSHSRQETPPTAVAPIATVESATAFPPATPPQRRRSSAQSYPPLLPFTGIPEPSESLAGAGSQGRGGRGYEDYRRSGPPPPPLALSTCVVRFAKTGALRGAALGPPVSLPAPLTEAAPPALPARPPPGPGPTPAPAKASPEAEEAARCVHCRALFRRRADGRGGRCAEAPDPGRLLVRRLSCLWCAESLLYHCLSDAEGDFSDPCACEPGHPRPAARWAALAALSLAVPCLCCYAPLRACHWVAARCGCAGCGGRHEEAAR